MFDRAIIRSVNTVRVGDVKTAACFSCQSFQVVRFQKRDVAMRDGSGIVSDILVGVCERCDSVSVIPQQAVPQIRSQLC